VADTSLVAAPALGGFNHEFSNCTLAERSDIALISVAVPRDGDTALSTKLDTTWALTMPTPSTTTQANGMRAIPLTADQFLLAFHPDTNRTEVSVQDDLAEVGYTTVQTDAWVILELSGEGATSALERICPLDLAPDAFPTGSAARTVMEHLGAMIVRVDDTRFWLMSARSSAMSFLHAVETSCRWTAS